MRNIIAGNPLHPDRELLLFDELSLVVVADREAVAGPQLAPLKLMLHQEGLHGLADLPDLFALTFDLLLEVEDRPVGFGDEDLDFAQAGFEALPLLLQQNIEGGKALFLALAQVFEFGEGQSLEQLRVFFDGTPEEVADADDQHGLPRLRLQLQQPGEVGVVAREFLGHPLQHLALGIEEALRVAEAGEFARLACQRLGIDLAHRQPAGLASRPQVPQRPLAGGGVSRGQATWGSVEEGPDLLAQLPVFRGG